MAAPTSSVDDSMATRSGRTRVVEVARCVIACVERVVGACRVPRFDRATGRVRRVTRRVPDAAGTSRRATTGAFSRRAFSTTRSPHTRSPGHSPRTRCRRHVTTCHHRRVLQTRVLNHSFSTHSFAGSLAAYPMPPARHDVPPPTRSPHARSRHARSPHARSRYARSRHTRSPGRSPRTGCRRHVATCHQELSTPSLAVGDAPRA